MPTPPSGSFNPAPGMPPQPPQPPPGTSPTPSQPAAPPKNALEDPTGVWQKWLSRSGTPATPEEVHMFFMTLFKYFNTIIQQDNAAAQRAAQYEKKVIEGQE